MKFRIAILLAILLHIILGVIMFLNHEPPILPKDRNIIKIKIGAKTAPESLLKHEKNPTAQPQSIQTPPFKPTPKAVPKPKASTTHNISGKTNLLQPQPKGQTTVIPKKKPSLEEEKPVIKSLAERILDLPSLIFEDSGIDVKNIKKKEAEEAEEQKKIDDEIARRLAEQKKQEAIKAAKARGEELGNKKYAEQLAVKSYNDILSLWLNKHKKYPKAAKGLVGNAVILLKIDRFGNILAYNLERKTGHPILDESIINMIERANPAPPFPEDYPDIGHDFFLIPIHIDP